MPRALRPILALGIVSTLTLLAIEWSVETLQGLPLKRSQKAMERTTGVPFDERRTVEVVRDLREAGTPAVPSVVPKVLVNHTMPGSHPDARFTADVFPLAGIAHRPTVQLCNELGTIPVFRSDRYGFYNNDAVWDSTPATLLLIGDSYVHGYCVPGDSTLAAFLGRRLAPVVNLGTGGNGPLAELATLTEFQSLVRPRVVLWFFYENDFRDLALERRHPTLTRYLTAGYSQGLPARQAEIDSALVPWVDRLYASGFAAEDVRGRRWHRLFTLFAVRTLLGAARTGRDESDHVPLFREVLRAARDRATAGGATMVFVFLPQWERWFQPRAVVPGTRDSALAVASGLGVPVIDLLPVFDTLADKAAHFGRRQYLRAHYSPLGYRLVAEVVANRMDSLLSSSRNPR